MSFAIHLNVLDEVLHQLQQAQNQLQRAYDFSNRLQCIADKVRDSLDEAQILQTAMQELAIGLGVESCDTGLYDLRYSTSTIAYEYVAGQVLTVQGLVISMFDYPDTYEQLLQGQSIHCCWYPLDLQNHNVRRIQGRYTTLAHPIIDNNHQVIGDMWLHRLGEGYFELEEIWLVQQVATQCAIAIRQARLYQAAQAQVTELARLNRLKDDFLTTVSHELRTPLSNTVMAVEMLELELEQAGIDIASHGNLSQYLAILKQESQREIALINDLVTLSRIETETEPLVWTTIEPHVWIAHVLESFVDYANSQQQQLEVNLPATLPPLTTDLTDLEQILSKLLTNACKCTPAGGTITVSAAVSNPESSDDPPMLELMICNTGVEISADECEHVFDMVHHSSKNHSGIQQEIGIGLALVKKLTERLGATIQANSKVGQLIFSLQLPLHPTTIHQDNF